MKTLHSIRRELAELHKKRDELDAQLLNMKRCSSNIDEWTKKLSNDSKLIVEQINRDGELVPVDYTDARKGMETSILKKYVSLDGYYNHQIDKIEEINDQIDTLEDELINHPLNKIKVKLFELGYSDNLIFGTQRVTSI